MEYKKEKDTPTHFSVTYGSLEVFWTLMKVHRVQTHTSLQSVRGWGWRKPSRMVLKGYSTESLTVEHSG
jgi:hypothetical protein